MVTSSTDVRDICKVVILRRIEEKKICLPWISPARRS